MSSFSGSTGGGFGAIAAWAFARKRGARRCGRTPPFSASVCVRSAGHARRMAPTSASARAKNAAASSALFASSTLEITSIRPHFGPWHGRRVRSPPLTDRTRLGTPSRTMRSPFRLVLAATLAVLVSFSGKTVAAQVKVAVVDVQRAVMQTEDGLRAQATLKKVFDSRQQEINKKQVEMQKQKEEIDKQSRVLSQQALQKKIDDWQKQMVELQGTFVEYNKELEKKQKELTDPIFERVIGAIKRVAGTDGYDLIVDRATVAFSRSDLDLTDRVIQLANSLNGGAAAPAPPSGATPPRAQAPSGPAKP